MDAYQLGGVAAITIGTLIFTLFVLTAIVVYRNWKSS